MTFKLINDLYESRLFPSTTVLNKFTVDDLENLVFLYFLTIQVLKSEFDTSAFALDYLYNTFKRGNFKMLQTSDTDFYWMLHIILNKDIGSLKSHPSNEIEIEKINLNETSLKVWAAQSIKARTDYNTDNRFLINLERSLNIRISDYKSIRLMVSNWINLDNTQKPLVMTRLLLALRKRSPKSELLPILEQLARHKGLEIHGVSDPENGGSPSKTSFIQKLAIAGMYVGAAAVPLIHSYNKTKEINAKIRSISPIHEDASGTNAGNIAGIVTPLKMIKRGNRTKKVK